MIRIKVCGMRDPDSIEKLVALRPDYIGFIFFPGSRRYVGREVSSIAGIIPNDIHKTGVFVNEEYSTVLEYRDIYNLDIVQLHGHESPEYCASLRSDGIPVIKAFQAHDDFTLKILESYTGACDYFLFDTANPAFGGSGMKFNWMLLERYDYEVPFFLSGGIGPEDADRILQINHPSFYAIDINSRFEISPGVKDIEKVRLFIKKIKSYDNEI